MLIFCGDKNLTLDLPTQFSINRYVLGWKCGKGEYKMQRRNTTKPQFILLGCALCPSLYGSMLSMVP